MSNILAITYEDGVPVTKSDTVNDPAGPFAGFYTGTGGDIRVLTCRGTDRTFFGTTPGLIMPVAIRRVFSSTTGASNVMGMVANPFEFPT